MQRSSLRSNSDISTVRMIQQLNLGNSLEQSLDSSSFFNGALPVTESPEASPTKTQDKTFSIMMNAHTPCHVPHASEYREDLCSSLDMDLSEEDFMGSDASRNGTAYCSSSYLSEREPPPIDLLSVGDRVGPGIYHEGELIRIAQTREGLDVHDPSQNSGPLQVVRLLGQGSYAVVYLVRELSSTDSSPPSPVDADFSEASTFDGQSQHHPFLSGKTPRQGNRGWAGEERLSNAGEFTYFALKCLSRRNLAPDQAQAQQNELTVHRSIPPHPNIITLYSAYETSDWLFLVLEYCPGKDLYFWLEEAEDKRGMPSSVSSQSHASTDLAAQERAPMEQNTSTTPWLLTRTSPEDLLSERRLQLVSDIFQQICKAVQFCHDLGISHRDLKPENFIVEDRRGSSDNQDDSVIVKLTDFGLATSAKLSCDFNCGSKPYMAFECRHDLACCYDPKQSDVWSLGVILLNLIFHRSPFMDASAKHCASFAAFTYKPILFLMQAFDGMTKEMALFLNENVFCDVSRRQRRRITPLAFGRWVQGLPQILGRLARNTARSPLSSVFAPPNTFQAKDEVQEYADKSSPGSQNSCTHSLSSSRELAAPMLPDHASTSDPVDNASSFLDPGVDLMPSEMMSGSLSMSRSSAPLFHALPG